MSRIIKFRVWDRMSSHKFLIDLFIEENCRKSINWGAEIKISKKLLSLCPELEFWVTLDKQINKLYSLAYFLNQFNKEKLLKQYIQYKDKINLELQAKEVYNKIENLSGKSKKKSLLEFTDI